MGGVYPRGGYSLSLLASLVHPFFLLSTQKLSTQTLDFRKIENPKKPKISTLRLSISDYFSAVNKHPEKWTKTAKNMHLGKKTDQNKRLEKFY